MIFPVFTVRVHRPVVVSGVIVESRPVPVAWICISYGEISQLYSHSGVSELSRPKSLHSEDVMSDFSSRLDPVRLNAALMAVSASMNFAFLV